MQKEKDRLPNIVLIVIDALRARNLGCYGAEGNPSPHIDRIAEQGILFENSFSCWNTTDQSLTSILTGRYPRTHGITHHGDKIPLEDLEIFKKLNIKLLSEILQRAGYRTFAVDWMGRWFKNGFDTYGYTPKRNLFQKAAYGLFTLPYLHIKYIVRGISIVKIYKKKRNASPRANWRTFKEVFQTFRFLFELARIHDSGFVTGLAEELIHRARGDRFFFFIHYWDTHPPYNCPRKYWPQGKIHNSLDMLSKKYQGAVKYVDRNLGRLLLFMEKEDLLDETLILITSDHGESLTEHEIFFDHHGLYDVTTHVPLILFAPELLPSKRRIKALVQHVDLVPTLCELLGIEAGERQWDGRSLLTLISGDKEQIRDHALTEESYAERKIALRTKEYKYIYAPDGKGKCKYCQRVHGGSEELYSLADDPEETENKIEQNQLQAEKMRLMITEIINALESKKRRGLKKRKDQKPSPELLSDTKEEKKIRKKFKSLGYMD
jgi:arylsulfatase A-like enzyme